MRPAILLLALGLVTPAAALQPAASDPAAAAAGSAATPERRDCLNNREIRGTRQRADVGYYAQTGKAWWRNTAQCAVWRPNVIITTFSNSDRQCSGDLVQVLDRLSRINYGGCTLGVWEKVAGPPDGVPNR